MNSNTQLEMKNTPAAVRDGARRCAIHCPKFGCKVELPFCGLSFSSCTWECAVDEVPLRSPRLPSGLPRRRARAPRLHSRTPAWPQAFPHCQNPSVSGISRRFPWFGKSFPGIVRSFPRFRKSFSGISRRFPWFRKSFSGISRRFPWFGKSFPGIGRGFPRFRKSFPGIGNPQGWERVERIARNSRGISSGPRVVLSFAKNHDLKLPS